MGVSSKSDKRSHCRNLVRGEVSVNDGRPYLGGKLRDMSLSGAAITYPADMVPMGEPVKVGQVLNLCIGGKANMPTRVVRVFDNGYAGVFDFALECAGAPSYAL